ncbi:MAG: transcription termination factor NusA [Candidatus Omnitrophota bacterium]
MNEELLTILEHLEREKGIKRDILIQAIESALISAVKKDLGTEVKDIQVKVNPESGAIQVFSDNKEVSAQFGRITAQTAKQVIIQKIREAERDVIFEDYQKKINTLTMGTVYRFDKSGIIVDLGKTEAVLPRSEQMPKESYKLGDRVRAYILEVKKTNKGPHIILSRTNAGFVKQMFELEVPEIYEGIVQIKAVAREAGERTKIAVSSNDEKVDCVGACVGMRGSRVKNIVHELRGERIDIIRWSENAQDFIAEALSPAKILSMKIDQQKHSAEVQVADDQLSLAIGKRGQNVRLACKLTGWDIDIKGTGSEKQPEPEKTEEPETPETPENPENQPAGNTSIGNIPGVGEKIAQCLIKAGFDTLEKLAQAQIADLTGVKGLGEKKAEKIISSAQGLLGEIK